MNTPKGYEKVKKLLISVFVLAMIVSLIGASLVGCSGSKSNTAGLQEATILIGVDAPLTGGAAPWGLSVEHGVTLAFDDANSAGGLTIGNTHYTFKVECLDDKYDTATTTNNIRQLVYSDGAQYIFTFQTEGTLALGPTLTKLQVISFTVVNDDAVIKQPDNSYTFRTFMPTSIQIDSYIGYLVKSHSSAKTISCITTNNDNGEFIVNLVKTAAKNHGLTSLDAILYDAGTTDFTPFVTKLLAEKPDIINMIGTPTGDSALIIKALYDAGYKGIIADGTVGAADLLPIAGQAALEGVYDSNLALQAPQVTTTVLGLKDREVARWGTAYCCTWDFYSQATLMYDAMKKAKSVNTTAVRNILQDPTQKWPYAALTGGVSVFDSAQAQALYGADATNQILNPWALCQIHDGQDKIVTIIEPPSK